MRISKVKSLKSIQAIWNDWARGLGTSFPGGEVNQAVRMIRATNWTWLLITNDFGTTIKFVLDA